MQAVVTGANGHIGSRIVRRLLEAGHAVRCLVRPNSNMRSLEPVVRHVELRRGDILDPESLRQVLEGGTHLFHTATFFSHDLRHSREILRTAVDGTRHVLRAAAEAASYERIVYTSSAVTMGSSTAPEEVRDESFHAEGEMEIYRRAKIEAEKLAFSLARELQLPLVAVNPTVVLGPGDHRPTPSNHLVIRSIEKGNRIFWRGGRNLVDVDDVAIGHLLASARGRIGERYLLAGDNLTIRDTANILARLSGAGAPRFEVSGSTLWTLGLALEILAVLKHTTPTATRAQAVAACGRFMYYDSQRAISELGYSWRKGEEVLARAVAWFLTTEHVKSTRRASARGFFQAVIGDDPEAVLERRAPVLGFAAPTN